MSITERQIALFIEGYLEAALWSSMDTLPGSEENDNPQMVSLDDFEWADGMEGKLGADCRAFIEANASDLLAYAAARGYGQFQNVNGYDVWEGAGHDFWLTRNGHGAGFWDHDLGELGERLTAASKAFGGVDLYLGDDEYVYASGFEG